MVKTDKVTMQKDLEEKEKALAIRLKTLEKQEEQIKEKAATVRSEVMKEMEKNEK